MDLPEWIGDTFNGRIVWATLFTFILLLPISLPRQLKALRFSSFLSFGISLFVVFTIFALSFKEKGPGHNDFEERFKFALENADITVMGVFNSLPLIIFAYMYQPNIPAIYHELKRKNLMNIKKVLGIGTLMASISYILTGVFGYVTFAMHKDQDGNPDVERIMEAQNILKADYGGIHIIKVCLLGVLIIVLFAAPFCVLPAKDSLEELLLKDS